MNNQGANVGRHGEELAATAGARTGTGGVTLLQVQLGLHVVLRLVIDLNPGPLGIGN